MRLRNTIAVCVCVGGSLLLLGCDQSGPGSTEATAKAASASSTNTVETTAEDAKLTSGAPADGTADLAPVTSKASKKEGRPEYIKPADPSTAAGDPRLTADEKRREAAKLIKPTDDPSLGALTVRAEPESLDLGQIATGDAKTGIVKLINFGSEPVKVVDCKSSCGCTAAKCPRGKIIDPGQSTEVEIKMSASTQPQKATKIMRFMIEGQPQLPLTVSSESVSYVLADPWTIDRDKAEGDTSTVALTSMDNESFRVLRMHPPIVQEFSNEAAPAHEVTLNWTRWEELGSSRRLTFYTDHPKCDKLFVAVQAIYKRPDRGDLAAKTNQRNQPGAEGQRQLDAPRLAEGQDGDVSDVIKRFPPPTENPVNLIKAGDTDKLLTLIESGDVPLEYQDRTGSSLLAIAAQHGQVEIVNSLIDLGIDVEARDRIGKTALMWAGHSKNPEVVRALLDAGADIRARDTVAGTALSWTAGFGDAESVKALIEAGADVNVTGSGMLDFTPLIWATINGSPETVNVLIEAGADTEYMESTSGMTPLGHAAQIGRGEIVKTLIDSGVDIDVKDRDGKTPLLVAAEKSGGNVETIKTLVEAGADLTATDLRGRNALDLANTRTDPRAGAVIEYLTTIIVTPSADAETADETDSNDE